MTPSANPSDDFLDVPQVAAWLNITVRHVRRLVFENGIPNHKIGGLVRLRRSEIIEWLKGNGGDQRKTAMAAQPEPLRLFELVEPPTSPTSQYETTTTPSHDGTTALVSSGETRSAVVSKRDPDDEVLHRVAEGATLLAKAQRRLDVAIDAARAAGHSWRTIGVLAGIPYQTLHRRRDDRGDTSRRSNSP